MTSAFPNMTKIIPESKRVPGKPYIIHKVCDEDSSRRTTLSGSAFRYVPPGQYCILKQARTGNTHESWDTIWMSDTLMERSTNIEFLQEAEGDVLLAGLGIGMLAVALCRKREVRTVTVLEIDRDVVRLVAPHIQHRKLRIVQADAKSAPLAGKNFDAIWLDIWPSIRADNWEEMKPMLADYRKLRRRDGIVTGWLKKYVQQEATREETWL